MRRRFLFLALWLIAGPVAAQVQTSVCEILKSPAAFDGKLVRLRATVIAGFEVFAVQDPEDQTCDRIWLVYAGGGPGASTSFGARTPDIQRPPVKLRQDDDFKRFQSLLAAEVYPRERRVVCLGGCLRYQVTATMTGRIDSAGGGQGFGHLNAYAAKLVLRSVSEATAEDQISQYEAELFSPTPVKFPTGYLAGRVLGSGGRLFAGVQVTVTSTEMDRVPVPPQPSEYLTDWTDENGGFSFEVPPGSYRLGANLESPASPKAPFPSTYYPGSTTEEGAKVVTVADGQHVEDLVIHTAPELRPRAVPVSVTWPDGKAVEQANVWLSEVAQPLAVVGSSVSHTGPVGSFELQGFEGIDYVVHANIYLKPSYTPYCAEKRTLKAGDKITSPLVMVLTRTGEVCRVDD